MVEFRLGEDVVEESHIERLLGLVVSRTLFNWGPQVFETLKGCAKKLSAFKLGGKYFCFKQRLETGKATNLRKLYHGIEVLGPGLSKEQIRTL